MRALRSIGAVAVLVGMLGVSACDSLDFGPTTCSGFSLNPCSPAQRLTITPYLDTVQVGGSVQFTATYYTALGVTPAVFTWSSSQPTAATVNWSGLVTGQAIGAATIEARTGNVVAMATVVVVAAPN